MRNRTRQQSMADRHDYDQKAEKTQDGELVSSFMCSPETAAEEFELSKRLYFQITGRSQPVHRDVIMYRVIQSFKPGEVSPEEANRIGYELAMKLTEGKHQFVVSTHVDKAHIHTHIEFNSTNLNCDGKFVNPKDGWSYEMTPAELSKKDEFYSIYWTEYRSVKNSVGAEISELPDYLEEKPSFDRKA